MRRERLLNEILRGKPTAFSQSIVIGIFFFIYPWSLCCQSVSESVYPQDSISILKYLSLQKWDHHPTEFQLNSTILKTSLNLAQSFIVSNQKSDGTFIYKYDWIKHSTKGGDDAVREAGALWGLSLLQRQQSSLMLQEAVERGIGFYANQSKDDVGKTIAVPDSNGNTVKCGTIALLGLSIIDYLRSNPEISPQHYKNLNTQLDSYLNTLLWMETKDGHFAYGFIPPTRSLPAQLISKSSPYYDGEALLCLVEAAKYLGKKDLIPGIETTAKAMVHFYVKPMMVENQDPDDAIKFYQWGAMSFWEIEEAGWMSSDHLDATLLVMAHWLIYNHQIVSKKINVAQSLEGLLPTYQLARKENRDAADEIAWVIDNILSRTLALQVGGPFSNQNPFIRDHSTVDPHAIGGFLRDPINPVLRIDFTQHSMHAVILALDDLYFH